MKITLKSSPKSDASFYIQCKGNHSGRPLKKSIPNSFSLYCKEDEYNLMWAIATGLYYSKKLQPYIIGTAIPFIRLRDYKRIFKESVILCNDAENYANAIEKIERDEEMTREKLSLMSQLKQILSLGLFKKK